MIRTKIVCTIGPACSAPAKLTELVKAGMDVARLNFSHAEYDKITTWVKDLRKISETLGKPIAILQDLQGPKIRVGEMKKGVILEPGSDVVLTTKKSLGTDKLIPVQYAAIAKDVEEGDSIYMDDGLLELKVLKTDKKTTIHCKVLAGGPLSSHKGINLPHTKISTPGITEKDMKDLEFGVTQNVDYVALSFVREAEDVVRLKKLIQRFGGNSKVIAKIERREALENLEAVIREADAIMIARGDMGIEVSLQEVPMVQKRIIKECIRQGKPVITATQMLDSMIRNPKPTRAEVSDVANAIIDGTDAVMLSGETAIGAYPIETVATMVKVAREAEENVYRGRTQLHRSFLEELAHRAVRNIPEAISSEASDLATRLEARSIIVATTTGTTARLVAKTRPVVHLVAVSPDQKVVDQLALVWGVRSYIIPIYHTSDELMSQAVDLLVLNKLVDDGDRVVIVAGEHTGISGGTNIIKVQTVSL